MELYDQIENWKNSHMLVELHLVSAGNKRSRMHGRVFSFDPAARKILFYNDDTKTIENVLLNEIENAFPADAIREQTAPDEAGASEQNPESDHSAKRMLMLEEIHVLASCLPDDDLEALLPLLRQMKRTAERDLSDDD